MNLGSIWLKFILGTDCLSCVRIRWGNVSANFCLRSLLNVGLPRKIDLGIKLSGGGGTVLGVFGIMGIAQFGSCKDGKRAGGVELTKSSGERNKKGLSFRNKDSSELGKGNTGFPLRKVHSDAEISGDERSRGGEGQSFLDDALD